MSKIRLIVLVICFVLCMTACSKNEEVTTDSTTDYPAAIMVEDTVYLYSMETVDREFDDSEITGYTTSYTDTFPEKNGETNFNREIDMPYVMLDKGVGVYYEDAWHLCTPKDTMSDVMIEYSQNDDGSWTCKDKVYQYKIELTGRDKGAEKDGWFLVLTNNKDVTFEEVSKSIYSSLMDDGLDPEETIIVEMGTK